MKAGLFDRAEEAWRALQGTGFDAEAQTALLSLYERSRDWQRAVDVANTLETRRTQALPSNGNGVGSGNGLLKPQAAGGSALTGSLASRIAHYHCELAEEADKQGRDADAQAHLQLALGAAPDAPRAHVLAGKRLAAAGLHAEALRAWDLLRLQHPAAFLLVAEAYAQAAMACGQVEAARASLNEQLERFPGNSLLQALAQLDKASGQPESLSLQRWLTQLTQRPSLSAAAALLAQPQTLWPDGSLAQVQRAVALAAKPVQRYRCAACGFEAQHYFWQCPGCLNWDSYPTQHIEEL
jgi:lipopolysaccharide assembly protein B